LWEIFRNEIMRMNTLSEYETLTVTASIWSIFDKRWNCYHCIKSKDHERIKKIQGCEFTPRTFYKIEGFKLNRCLGNFTSREVLGFFEMFKLYSKGIMPFDGCMSDQPAKLIDLFNMIDLLQAEKHEERRKAQEMASKAKR